jgi:hypothetical protein
MAHGSALPGTLRTRDTLVPAAAAGSLRQAWERLAPLTHAWGAKSRGNPRRRGGRRPS